VLHRVFQMGHGMGLALDMRIVGLVMAHHPVMVLIVLVLGHLSVPFPPRPSGALDS
jgi:hypothetical protein